MNPPTLGQIKLFEALSQFFSKPGAEQVCMGFENPLLSALGFAANEEAEEEGPFGRLFDHLWIGVREQDQRPAERALLDLEVEFARLFLVPSEVRIMPYEHWITGKSPALLATTLKASYGKVGLALASTERDLPDHISTELEFVARSLASDQIDIARSFVQNHLAAFGLGFAAKVDERSEFPVYSIAAQTLIQLLSLDSLKLEAPTDCIEC
jgi:TorA maturation chaperone TorD